MTTVVKVFGLQAVTVVSVTRVYASKPTVLRLGLMHNLNPISPIAGYTPANTPWVGVVKTVPPLPGGSAGGGTVGYAF